MSDLKSQKYADKHKLEASITVDDKTGVMTASEDFVNPILEESNLTLDQIKKLQKKEAEHLAASTLVAGEKAAEHFKENPETKELAFEYDVGHNRFQTYFSREENASPVRNTVSVHGAQDKGELKKVHKHVGGLFDNINS